MTVSNEQLNWLLENDPEFRKQYEAIALAQAFGGQPTQPLQAAPEAPQRRKNRVAGILAGVLSIAVLIGAGYGAWRYLDVSIAPVQTQTQMQSVKVLPTASNSGAVPSGASADEITVPVSPAMAEKVIGEAIPMPTLAPAYAQTISEQAPHAVRSYGVPNQPTPESALNAVLSSAPAEPTGVAVPVPTISQQQAKIIGAQAPHKVR